MLTTSSPWFLDDWTILSSFEEMHTHSISFWKKMAVDDLKGQNHPPVDPSPSTANIPNEWWCLS